MIPSPPTPPADAHSGVSNPFSTRFVQPGAIPYFWGQGDTVEGIVAKLRIQGWWGEITGPHGSGKSTLLAALLKALTDAGQRPFLIELHDGQRTLGVELSTELQDPPLTPPGPRVPGAPRGGKQPTMIVVDGYEQLSWWSKFRLKRFCRSRKLGLLVTSHQSQGLGTIYHTQPTSDLARQLVEHLLPDKLDWIKPDELQSLYAAQHGNLRELLFALYDRYEARRKGDRST